MQDVYIQYINKMHNYILCKANIEWDVMWVDTCDVGYRVKQDQKWTCSRGLNKHNFTCTCTGHMQSWILRGKAITFDHTYTSTATFVWANYDYDWTHQPTTVKQDPLQSGASSQSLFHFNHHIVHRRHVLEHFTPMEHPASGIPSHSTHQITAH